MSDVASEGERVFDFAGDRYASLKLIDWFDLARVQRARMLVIGAGAIGNEVLKNLALLGVGNVFIYDFDTIEMSNLSRSILFRPSDNGQPKAKTAARAVADINPDICVRWRDGDIRFDLGLGLIRRMDVVIGCLDNLEARLRINAKCYRTGRPWIDAGIRPLYGQVNVYQPPQGACYECAFTAEDYQQVRKSCEQIISMYIRAGKVPTTPTMAAIVAGVQVQEALKLLAYNEWEGRTLVGREFSYSSDVQHVNISSVPRREDCPAHYTIKQEDIVELPNGKAAQTTFGELLQMMREHLGAEATLLLNFDLALSVTCSHCDREQPLLKPLRKVFKENLRCEKCGRERKFVPTTNVTRTVNSAQAHYETLRDLPLASAKIPPLDILTGVSADGNTAHFELTGDELELMGTLEPTR